MGWFPVPAGDHLEIKQGPSVRSQVYNGFCLNNIEEEWIDQKLASLEDGPWRDRIQEGREPRREDPRGRCKDLTVPYLGDH
jgi:hypothetical protein